MRIQAKMLRFQFYESGSEPSSSESSSEGTGMFPETNQGNEQNTVAVSGQGNNSMAGQEQEQVAEGSGSTSSSSSGSYKSAVEQHVVDDVFVPSQPIPIPNTAGAIRLPAGPEGGPFVISGSHAPTRMEDLEELARIQAIDEALADRYEQMKRVERARQESMAAAKAATNYEEGGRRPNSSSSRQQEPATRKYPTVPRTDVAVGNAIMLAPEEDLPRFFGALIQPYSGQYPQSLAFKAYAEGIEKGTRDMIEEKDKARAFRAGYEDFGATIFDMDEEYDRGGKFYHHHHHH
ncbi:hypothetical protein GGS20DRAFT_572890 [Poronia punctata]|nr:hypothetical protein GGS20DRAFT_572890 [Poronia punctata]